MEHQNSWLVEGHIVLCIPSQEASDETLRTLDASLLTFLEQAQSKHVHFIFDLSAQVKVNGLKSMTGMQFNQHPNIGWSLMIGNLNPVVRTVISLAARVTGARFRIMDTREDALAFLKAIDLSIPSDEEQAV